MWVIALYVPAMETVNRYWIAPQWSVHNFGISKSDPRSRDRKSVFSVAKSQRCRIAMSIMSIEILSIFLPCWQAVRHQALQQETLDVIAAWESRQINRETNKIGAATMVRKARHESSFFEKGLKGSSSTDSIAWSDNSLLNMSALERTLEDNPGPLRDFSALNDFSGENIAFLEAVAEWKRTFTSDNIRNQFIRALGIYHEFVSPRDAEFPINISFQEMAQLEATFEKAARIIYGDTRPDHISSPSYLPGFEWPMEILTPKKAYMSDSTDSPDASTRELRSSLKHVSYWGEIPVGFNAEVFDVAERSIKYLVLTNTWPKFLSWKSSEASRSDLNLTKHDGSFLGRVSRFLSCDV